MKTYKMVRDENGDAFAYVDYGHGRCWLPLPLRLDLANHSPDGFEWGYGGSGPAQLALALLANVYDVPERKKSRGIFDEASVAEKHYQQFKWQWVSSTTDNEWYLNEQQIRDWVMQREIIEAQDRKQS